MHRQRPTKMVSPCHNHVSQFSATKRKKPRLSFLILDVANTNQYLPLKNSKIFWNTFTYQIAFQLFIDLRIPWDTSAGTTSKTLGELSKFLHVQTSFSVSFCYPIFVSPQILSNVIPQINMVPKCTKRDFLLKSLLT